MENAPPLDVLVFAFQTRSTVPRPILLTHVTWSPEPLERIGLRSSESSAERPASPADARRRSGAGRVQAVLVSLLQSSDRGNTRV